MIAAVDKEKAQYTFDVMASHLLTQGKRSEGMYSWFGQEPKKGCAYRGDDGARCVVGFCIKDEKYNPELEGIGTHSLEVQEAMDDSYYKERTFLGHMQTIHDTQPITHWSTVLKEAAELFGLDSSIVDTFTNITIPQPEVLVYEEIL